MLYIHLIHIGKQKEKKKEQSEISLSENRKRKRHNLPARRSLCAAGSRIGLCRGDWSETRGVKNDDEIRFRVPCF